MTGEQLPLPGDGFGGPYVGIAVFCEKVLREADGVISVIRIIDRITFQGDVNGSNAAAIPAYQLFLVVMLKAGHAQGTFTVGIRSSGPSGQDLGTVQAPVLFEGNERGVSLVLQFPFQPVEEGLYWFDISVEGQHLTRIPLRAIFQRISMTGAGSGQ